RLELSQTLQSSIGKRTVEKHVLQGDNQAVTTEYRHKPGHASGWHPQPVANVLLIQAQRAHVAHRPIVSFLHMLIGCPNQGCTLFPLPLETVHCCVAIAGPVASIDRVLAPALQNGDKKRARMPLPIGRETDIKRKGSVCIMGL